MSWLLQNVLAALLSMAPLASFGGLPPSPGISAQQQQMLDLVNQERTRAGLQTLRWDSNLAEAARAHTEMMAARKDLSHQFPGEPPLMQRAGSAGANFNSVAENVAYAPNVVALHNNLMHSPPHRANILAPESNAVGIAFVERDGELFVTEDFAHLLTNLSEEQFSDQVAGEVNRLRKKNGLPPLTARRDSHLQQTACQAKLNPKEVIQGLPGATNLAMFTASQPSELPSSMVSAAGNVRLRRMNIGVCFKQGGESGFSKYWVVAAFYPLP